MNSDLKIALNLISENGWDIFSLTDMAIATQKPLYEAQEKFGNKYGVLQAFYLHINREVEGEIQSPEDSIHDWLFELFMARFDALEDFKSVLQELNGHMLQDARLAKLIACNLHEWMGRVSRELPETAGVLAKIRPATLCLIYAAALETWLQDDTVDASHTMATLDQRLSDFEAMFAGS